MGRTARDRLSARAAALAAGDQFLRLVRGAGSSSRARFLLVGGALRDLALGREPRDLDFIAAGPGARRAVGQIARRAGRRLVTFRKRGIVNHRITAGGRDHDFVQVAGDNIRTEIARRDFTINAIAWDLHARRLLDPRRGLDDLTRRTLRAGPEDVFRDDPLRMLRAVRLRGELSRFSIALRTTRLIRRDATLVRSCSPERVRDELDRILASPMASSGIAMLDRLGVLEPILPEIGPLKGLVQNRYHHLDAWRHTLAALREADAPGALLVSKSRVAGEGVLGNLPASIDPREGRLLLRWALLFHDLGKADTVSVDENGDVHFFGHEKASTLHAANIMDRLRFSKHRSRAIRTLVAMHLRIAIPADGDLSDRACRRIIRDAGDLTPLLVLHSLADKQASRGRGWLVARRRLARTGRKLLETYRHSREAILEPPALVSGRDVMKILGIKPGPEIGRILDAVRERQIAGEISVREDAVEFVRRMGDEL